MPIKKARTSYILLPDKQWMYRASLFMLVTASIALMVMSKTNNPAVTKLRTHITDGVIPLLTVAASPMDALHNAGVWMVETVRLREENITLKNANIELLKWQSQAKSMEVENEALRNLLKVVPTQKATYITARLVSDIGGPFMHSALINGGSANGIQKDQAAISENGLLGRIVDVGEHSARVLLLNDINSRVPVIAEHAREKSILMGNNTTMPVLSYLATDSKVKVGERIITSGDGGIFPEGIPVGIVVAIHKNIVRVQPYVDATKVQYMSVIDYSF
jgi:rod shape-determining protein MreC